MTQDYQEITTEYPEIVQEVHLIQPDELLARINKLKGRRFQCVIFARLVTNNQTIRGMAKYVPVNSTEPLIGAGIKLSSSLYGHIGVVTGIDGDYIVYADANGDWKGSIVMNRKIHRDDPKILGYIH